MGFSGLAPSSQTICQVGKWNYEIVHSSIKTTATKTLTFYNDELFISKTSARVSKWEKHFENTNYPNQSRCKAPPDWLRTPMAQIVPSLQLAKTEDHSYTLHLTSYTLQVVREFFCIEHSLCGTILCRLASRASCWLVGNYQSTTTTTKFYWLQI